MMDCQKVQIREMRREEYPQLEDFLYAAIYVPEGQAIPPRSIIRHEALRLYVDAFGDMPDDYCLVAECSGRLLGAAWVRIMDDYGHLDDETPSLAIALRPEYRGKGIGTQLLENMLGLLKKHGYAKLSLSVQKANPAIRLYSRLGFSLVEDRGEECLMCCSLAARECPAGEVRDGAAPPRSHEGGIHAASC